MKVLLGFNAQYCGYFEKEVDIPYDKFSHEYVLSIFPIEMGLEFDNNCFYEIK
jgi:hypothetical protein